MRLLLRLCSCLVVVSFLLLGSSVAAADGVSGEASGDASGDWLWPIDGPRTVVEPFRAPAHAYGAGHRGIDIAAPIGTEVHAPADGVVAFRGVVVDRPLITIEHAGGYVTTFEPLESALSPGVAVAAGDVVGTVRRVGLWRRNAAHRRPPERRVHQPATDVRRCAARCATSVLWLALLRLALLRLALV